MQHVCFYDLIFKPSGPDIFHTFGEFSPQKQEFSFHFIDWSLGIQKKKKMPFCFQLGILFIILYNEFYKSL